MEGNQFRSSSNGQLNLAASKGQTTDGIEELRERLQRTTLSDISQADSPSQQAKERIFVAVGKEHKESKSVLAWVLQYFPRSKNIVLTHVHRPDQLIPMMGGKFHASKLSEEQVASHRQLEREKMNKTLSQYRSMCASAKFEAETLVIEMDDVAKGLLALIDEHRIRNLVMGAASDKNYSRKMSSPKSRKAKTVRKEAATWCRVLFVCKGNLICVREAGLDDAKSSSTSASASSTSSRSDSVRETWSQDGPLSAREEPVTLRSISEGPHRRELSVAAPQERAITHYRGSLGRQPGEYFLFSDNSSSSLYEEPRSSPSPSAPELEDSVAESLAFLQGEIQDDMYSQVQLAFAEVESAKREAYEESCRRQKAERDAVEATRRAMTIANMHEKESKQRREAEAALARETEELEKLRRETLEALRQSSEAQERRSALEAQLTQSAGEVRALEQKLSEAQLLVSSLQRECQELREERDDALREAGSASLGTPGFSVFNFAELDRATRGFDPSLKIGEGGYGAVYKGVLRHTVVAIKRLHSLESHGQQEFRHEVEVLRRVRHPNLVTLIGVCPEAWCLVYEFLPNGSLEDRLACKDNSPPLPWQARLLIAADICSALIFLHSSEPHGIVHGDLKPANVLLDASFTSKLGDFGLSRLLSHPGGSSSSSSSAFSFICNRTDPKGTVMYMDPEILVTGEITSGSDVYALGVIILRLLTGRPPQRLAQDVKEALETNTFHRMVDQTAGDWPFVQAKQLAHLALQCCAMTHTLRPDLVDGVWRILEPMKNSACARPSPSLPARLPADDDSGVPSYFFCPIFMEVMRDPQVAADGYTYEGEAVRGWFEGGNHTSPMTNLILPHQQLIPNVALRSAIKEWLQQQHRPL